MQVFKKIYYYLYTILSLGGEKKIGEKKKRLPVQKHYHNFYYLQIYYGLLLKEITLITQLFEFLIDDLP